MADLKMQTDPSLLSLIREDNEAAFTEIYNRYWQTLYAIGYNRIRDSKGTEDIVHDVFTALWHNRAKDNILNLKAYLATSVKYMTLAHLRRSQVRFNYMNSQASESITEAHADELIDHRRILVLIQQEVEKLPEKCRLVFKYSREHNKSTREIAEELQISPSTVENHLNKALSRLKVVLKNFNCYLFSIFF